MNVQLLQVVLLLLVLFGGGHVGAKLVLRWSWLQVVVGRVKLEVD